MTTIFLCGGRGTRLYPLTKEIPKPMILVAGKPLIIRNMEKLIDCGQRDFIFCLGYLSSYFLNYFQNRLHCIRSENEYILFKGNWSGHQISVTCMLGEDDWKSARRLRQVAMKIKNLKKNIVLIYGDLYFEDSFKQIIKRYEKESPSMMMCVTHPQSQYGVVNLSSSNQVATFREKPVDYSTWINAGFYIFDRDFFNEMLKNSGESFEREILPMIIENKSVYKLSKFWKSMENTKDMEEIANRIIEGH